MEYLASSLNNLQTLDVYEDFKTAYIDKVSQKNSLLNPPTSSCVVLVLHVCPF